jgi:3,4-dihydroxy-2-butanone 4-phosphate synthase
MSALAPITDIIADIKAGKMVILVDEEDRENEGDLVMAAEFVTPEAINFMAKHGRGLICLTLTDERCRQLGLQQMVRDNRTPHGTAFTVSIEAATGVTTGISAHDRARTVQVAVARNARPDDIVTPGHIFPLTAQKGGVLIRAGHTEAGCDLAQLAGLEPASVICEILKDDGTMARRPPHRGLGPPPRPQTSSSSARRTASGSAPSATSSSTAPPTTTWSRRSPRRTWTPPTAASASPPSRTRPRATCISPCRTVTSAPSARLWCGCTSRSRCSTSSTPAAVNIPSR